MRWLLSIALLAILAPVAFPEVAKPREAAKPVCEDAVHSKVVIDPKIQSAFFEETVKSYPSHVVEHAHGKLEDTLDGVMEAEDREQLVHTSNCVSSHQGNHAMEFCEARLQEGNLTLAISGGLPAYASSLSIGIDRGLNVRCSFEAEYPAPTNGLGWRITKKEIRLREARFGKGTRLYGWISVEFEESSVEDGKKSWKPHKIEGFIKPIVGAVPAGE